MEETLGKRIVANRKRLGITQDRLAEQLGVTAQAVSKWENDLSCPDIAILPKLAEIFGTSVDALLGIARPGSEASAEAKEAELVEEEEIRQSTHNANWEFHWDAGRKSYLGLAVWIILTAGWMFGAAYLRIDADFWDLLWTNGLITFGLFGLFPRFSFFHLGCTLFGIHGLLEELDALPGYLGKDLLLPAFLLLLGLSFLGNALRKPRSARFHVTHNGKSVVHESYMHNQQEDSFNCACAFSGKQQLIALPRLQQGNAEVCFGHLTVDLSGCETFAENCRIHAECAFGELVILVPSCCKAEVYADSSFGSVEIPKTHPQNTDVTVFIHADANFGRIAVKYI